MTGARTRSPWSPAPEWRPRKDFLQLAKNERLTGFVLNGSGPGPRGKIAGKFSDANGTRTLTVRGLRAKPRR